MIREQRSGGIKIRELRDRSACCGFGGMFRAVPAHLTSISKQDEANQKAAPKW